MVFVREPTPPRAESRSVLRTKHSAVLVFPMLLILAAIEIFQRESTDSGPQLSAGNRAARYATALVIIGLMSVAILWVAYGPPAPFHSGAQTSGDWPVTPTNRPESPIFSWAAGEDAPYRL
jgi:hypothetical protein